MPRLVPALVLPLLVLLAGCAASDVEPAPTAPRALDEPLSPTDCHLGLLIFLTTLEQAQRQLPPGFVARDAQAVLGTPVATGKGAVVVGNVECADSTFEGGYAWGELLIAVEAPVVDAELEPSTLDYYAPVMHVRPGPVRELFVEAGWPLVGRDLTVEVTAGAVGGSSTGALADDEGALWEFEINGAASLTATAFERIWHAPSAGLTFLENVYSNRAWLGEGSCTLGGPASEIVGVSSCADADIVGAVAPTQSWEARIVSLPGVHAGGSGAT